MEKGKSDIEMVFKVIGERMGLDRKDDFLIVKCELPWGTSSEQVQAVSLIIDQAIVGIKAVLEVA